MVKSVTMANEPVLVVDDNEEDREAIAGLLRQDGFAVETVTNGLAAVELLKTKAFDLLLTDLVMPGTTGFDVLRAARAADPELICIALTSFGSLDSATDALNLGAYSYLLKPCEDAALRNTLKRGLEKRRLTKELRQRNQELEALNRDLDMRVQKAVAELQALNHRMLTEMASLREVDELKNAFLDNVSHDLRGPVMTIRGYLGLVLDKPETLTADARGCLQKAEKAVDHLEYLIGQLLESTRLTSGLVTLSVEEVGVRQILDECAALFAPQAGAAGVQLSIDGDGGAPPLVRADRGRLLQILNNLIGNAVKFTPRGGRVAVSAKGEGPDIVFTVADTGPGIGAEHLPRIFERFYQADRAPKHEAGKGAGHAFKGLGLGLRIARDIVSLHGGRIWVDSAPGRGSRFHVALPLTGPAPRN